MGVDVRISYSASNPVKRRWNSGHFVMDDITAMDCDREIVSMNGHFADVSVEWATLTDFDRRKSVADGH